jgi:hypothetical protein
VVCYRELAREFNVGWNEYWSFLDTFTNFASQDGLQKLEAYLKTRFQEAVHAVEGFLSVPSEKGQNQSSDVETVSPVSDLCHAFKACSLSEGSPAKPLGQSETKTTSNVCSYHSGNAEGGVEDEALLNVLQNSGLSPFLYVEKSCQVFGKRIFDGLRVAVHSTHIGDSVLDMLWPEIKHLQDLVRSFKDDSRFVSVDFNLIHSRIASVVVERCVELAYEELEFLVLGLKSTLSSSYCSHSDEEDNISTSYHTAHRYAEDQRKKGGEYNQIKCIATLILSALEQGGTTQQTHRNSCATEDIHVQTEEECMGVWSDAVKCSCFRQNQNSVRNARKASSFKRSQSVRYKSPTSKGNTISSLDGITRRLTFDGEFMKAIRFVYCIEKLYKNFKTMVTVYFMYLFSSIE